MAYEAFPHHKKINYSNHKAVIIATGTNQFSKSINVLSQKVGLLYNLKFCLQLL